VSAITLAASLAQATSAVALVLGGALVFDLGREALVGIAEGPVTRAGDLVIAALGTWLVWRGLRGFWKMQATDHHHHGDACGCGHDHVPDPDAAARAGWGEALLLIGGVALRPCTGALFVMLLTVLIGAPLVGIAATYAIGGQSARRDRRGGRGQDGALARLRARGRTGARCPGDRAGDLTAQRKDGPARSRPLSLPEVHLPGQLFLISTFLAAAAFGSDLGTVMVSTPSLRPAATPVSSASGGSRNDRLNAPY